MLALRQLKERLRVVGYPQTVSSDTFFSPNFESLTQILEFLVVCYDPEHSLSSKDLKDEESKAHFIKLCVLFFMKKANIKLNPKRLYSADISAVQELLKVADALYKARKSIDTNQEHHQQQQHQHHEVNIPETLSQVKACRSLGNEIREKTTKMSGSLEKEVNYQQKRSEVLGQSIQIQELEEVVQENLSTMSIQIEATQSGIEKLNMDKGNISTKMEKRKKELDRIEKRLKSLVGVRPPYMDEYEKLEEELAGLFKIYTEKFRHLAYLEHQLDLVHEQEAIRHQDMDRGIQKLKDQLQEEEFLLLKGDTNLNHIELDDLSDEEDEDSIRERVNEYRQSSFQYEQRSSMVNRPMTSNDEPNYNQTSYHAPREMHDVKDHDQSEQDVDVYIRQGLDPIEASDMMSDDAEDSDNDF